MKQEYNEFLLKGFGNRFLNTFPGYISFLQQIFLNIFFAFCSIYSSLRQTPAWVPQMVLQPMWLQQTW